MRLKHLCRRFSNNVVRRVAGVISTFAGTGTAAGVERSQQAQLNGPQSVAVDPAICIAATSASFGCAWWVRAATFQPLPGTAVKKHGRRGGGERFRLLPTLGVTDKSGNVYITDYRPAWLKSVEQRDHLHDRRQRWNGFTTGDGGPAPRSRSTVLQRWRWMRRAIYHIAQLGDSRVRRFRRAARSLRWRGTAQTVTGEAYRHHFRIGISCRRGGGCERQRFHLDVRQSRHESFGGRHHVHDRRHRSSGLWRRLRSRVPGNSQRPTGDCVRFVGQPVYRGLGEQRGTGALRGQHGLPLNPDPCDGAFPAVPVSRWDCSEESFNTGRAGCQHPIPVKAATAHNGTRQVLA